MNKFEFIFIVVFTLAISYAVDVPYKFTQLDRNVDVKILNDNFQYFSDNAQDKKFTIYSSTPTTNDGENGNIAILDSAQDRLCVKINGQWRFIYFDQ
jgi:hypothetical protein